MSNVYYYGKTTKFVGKTLFEILANLRNFGVNRMIIKQLELLQDPGTKCYYIVKKVEPVMDEQLQEGAIYAERIYRNAKVPGEVFVDEESWHTDWQLVPKDEEHLHKLDPESMIEHGHPSTVHILPRWMEMPPLMDRFIRQHYKERDGVQVAPVKMGKRINIRTHYDFDKLNWPHQVHRVAEEGEKPHSKLPLLPRPKPFKRELN